MSVAALLMAAGESTRMGSPKPLLLWDGENLIRYQVRQLKEAGANHIVAVLGHGAIHDPVIAGKHHKRITYVQRGVTHFIKADFSDNMA